MFLLVSAAPLGRAEEPPYVPGPLPPSGPPPAVSHRSQEHLPKPTQPESEHHSSRSQHGSERRHQPKSTHHPKSHHQAKSRHPGKSNPQHKSHNQRRHQGRS